MATAGVAPRSVRSARARGWASTSPPSAVQSAALVRMAGARPKWMPGFTPVTRHHKAVRIRKRFVKLVLETARATARLRARPGPTPGLLAAQAGKRSRFRRPPCRVCRSARPPRRAPRQLVRFAAAPPVGSDSSRASSSRGHASGSPRRALTRASVTSAGRTGRPKARTYHPMPGVRDSAASSQSNRSARAAIETRGGTRAPRSNQYLARTRNPSFDMATCGKRLAESNESPVQGSNRPPHRHDPHDERLRFAARPPQPLDPIPKPGSAGRLRPLPNRAPCRRGARARGPVSFRAPSRLERSRGLRSCDGETPCSRRVFASSAPGGTDSSTATASTATRRASCPRPGHHREFASQSSVRSLLPPVAQLAVAAGGRLERVDCLVGLVGQVARFRVLLEELRPLGRLHSPLTARLPHSTVERCAMRTECRLPSGRSSSSSTRKRAT